MYLQFDGRTPVQMRVAVSYVSLDGARRNLAAEVGGANFDAVRKAARRTWNGRLGQVAVSGGSKDERRTFFTALYHALLQPYVFDDVDRRYAGFDGRTHRVRPGHHHYATFSGWDIYRSEVQLLAFLAPDIASDVAQSLYDNAHAIGDVWDRWSHNNTITGVMNGDPYHSIVASVYAFGARQFAARAALASMVRGAERIGPDPATGYEERPGNADYLRRGYVPGDVSTTLEYGVADFGIAQLAQRLGNAPVHRTFMRRAQAWENLFNPANRWIQPRFADGSFLAPFDPADPTEYVEGNGAQYHWMVPHDVAALVSSMGGRQVVTRRLDHFFSQLNAGPRAPYAYLGNQPSLLSPWLYAWTGAPWRTQDTVRRAQRLLYKPTPDGLVGNDDLGTMSAWYVWASLGMYPAIPGRAELVLNSPLFPRTVVRRSSGQVVTISAPQASPARRYVQAVSVNGKPISRAWLPETFVASGGRLDFRLSTTPDRRFGSDPSDAPPSFGEGRNRLVVTPSFVRVQPGDAVSVTSRAADATYATGAVVGRTTVHVNVARPRRVEWYADNAGISDDADPETGNFDGGGWSYSAQALAEAGLTLGRPLRWEGFRFTWPHRRAGEPDNVVARGQRIELRTAAARSTRLAFLGAASNGNARGRVAVIYTDGTKAYSSLGFSDWALGANASPPAYGNEVAARMPYRNGPSGSGERTEVYVFVTKPVHLDPAKQVSAIVLPASPQGGVLHLFGWAFAGSSR